MVKRTVATSLILLSNIVLLAITAVPHHHHEELMCFADCHSHQSAHDDGCKRGDAGCCSVKEWLLPDVESGHRYQHQCHCLTRGGNANAPVAVLPDLCGLIALLEGLLFQQTRTDDADLRTAENRAPGLRAPPFYKTRTTRICPIC